MAWLQLAWLKRWPGCSGHWLSMVARCEAPSGSSALTPAKRTWLRAMVAGSPGSTLTVTSSGASSDSGVSLISTVTVGLK
ncbi:hypothetical protein GY14_20990 [Delftia tsuruhatensis]|nr:hypothetical protein GY14_20990 [Delftia tsuruhatensis]